MTSNSLPAMLHATLNPLNAIQDDLQAALELARTMKLSRPYLNTIKGAIADIAAAWDNLNHIATTLDPDRGTHKL